MERHLKNKKCSRRHTKHGASHPDDAERQSQSHPLRHSRTHLGHRSDSYPHTDPQSAENRRRHGWNEPKKVSILDKQKPPEILAPLPRYVHGWWGWVRVRRNVVLDTRWVLLGDPDRPLRFDDYHHGARDRVID